MRRSPLLLLAAAALSGACAQIPVNPGMAPAPVDTLFYISARARDEGRDSDRLAGALEYGLVISRKQFPPDPLTDPVPFTIVDTLMLSREGFVQLLRARTGSTADAESFAVLYTHGYGTSLHDAWEHSTTSRTRTRGVQPWVVFAWPTVGSGMIWPRNGHFLASAYRQDEAMARASRAAYSEALTSVHEAVGGQGLVMVAHSMGSQMVSGAMATDLGLRARLQADPLRALAFVSPDIEVQLFADSVVPTVRPLTQRLLLYASADDRVLAVSQMINDSERAGRIRDEDHGPMVRDGLEAIDMTDGQRANSMWVHAFGTRHALRRKSAALFDIVHLVGARRGPECREALGTAERLSTGAWRLTSAPLPDVAAVAGCRYSVAVAAPRRRGFSP
jgi:esterase/lipase superfamily enzyme